MIDLECAWFLWPSGHTALTALARPAGQSPIIATATAPQPSGPIHPYRIHRAQPGRHTGAGRFARLRMHTIMLAEAGKSTAEVSLKEIVHVSHLGRWARV